MSDFTRRTPHERQPHPVRQSPLAPPPAAERPYSGAPSYERRATERRNNDPRIRAIQAQLGEMKLTPEEARARLGFIQKIMPSCTVNEIQDCLRSNDFHVKKTVEALCDRLTLMAANMEQSKMMVAQSVAFMQQSQMLRPPQTPGQLAAAIPGSFWMKLQQQPAEPPQGLSGQEMEAHGLFADVEAPDALRAAEDLRPAHFVSKYPDQVIRPSGKKKALLIGINYHGSKRELNGCCDDVDRMKRLISRVYGFLDQPECMTILTDRPGGNPTLLPTKRNVIMAMKWLVDDAQKGDVLFFHFSGHGGQKRNLTGTEIDGFDETIMPLDYKKNGHITDDMIHDLMVKPLKNGVKLICVMDCCHSGSGMDLPFYWEDEQWKKEPFPKYSEGDVQLFSSCQDSETAADLMIPSWGAGGAVTLALVTALSQKPFDWTYRGLMNQVNVFLSERRFSQQPQLSSTQKFNLDRKFSVLEITANQNPMIGREKRKNNRRVPAPPAMNAQVGAQAGRARGGGGKEEDARSRRERLFAQVRQGLIGGR